NHGSGGIYNLCDGASATLTMNNTIVANSVATIVVTGDTTLGSTTISNMSSVAGINVPDLVTRPGIPANTSVTSVGANSITLTQPATSSNAAATYTITGTDLLSTVNAGGTITNTGGGNLVMSQAGFT